MPEIRADFKSTTVTKLDVTDTAEVANLKLQRDSDPSKYDVVKFNPDMDFSTNKENIGDFIPTINQVIQYITSENRATVQIYDLATQTQLGTGLEDLKANISLSDSSSGSGIYVKPQLNKAGMQNGYLNVNDISTYNANRLTPQSESGVSNLKKYWVTDITIGSGKSLTVYNQGTMNLAYNSSSTSWSVSISSDGNTITFQ